MPAADLFGLEGKTAFLSGAAGHLGRAMAWGLARSGAHVILNGRTEAKLEELRAELAGAGLKASSAAFDVRDSQAKARLFGSLDRLDVLINNAVTGMPKRDDGAADPFMAMIESGVAAADANVRAALPALQAAVRAAGQASVINVTSIYAHVSPRFSVYGDSGLRSAPQYSAAKGGLLQLTRYLACELGPSGVRVNSLSPGIFPWDEIARDHPDFVRRAGAETPLGRTGRPEELTGAVVFLASDASSYMTGADLKIDGGWTAW